MALWERGYDAYAFGVYQDVQVGTVSFGSQTHAGLWRGSEASWVDLFPIDEMTSGAFGVSGLYQVGFVPVEIVNPKGQRSIQNHASLWEGTAESLYDLNPVGATESCAYGVSGGFQVGYAILATGDKRASVWESEAESWTDLHAQLPAGFTRSVATSVWTSATQMHIAGYGFNSATNREEALMWSTRINCNQFAEQPQDQAAIFGGVASFEVQAVDPETTYRWRKSGLPLADDARVSGSATNVLTILGVQNSDQGAYDCLATNPCGSVRSGQATLSCRAVVTQQPIGGESVGPRTFILTAQVASGGTTTFRWRKDGQNLFNGAVYSGVTTTTLTINGNDPSQSGAYTLAITNPCGLTTTAPAAVSITCRADFNRDGFTDFFDYDAFVTAYEAGGGLDADFNEDGFIDFFDYDGFVEAFEMGC